MKYWKDEQTRGNGCRCVRFTPPLPIIINFKTNKKMKIKTTAGESLNLLKIAYPIVHPSFHRRHMFAVLERTIKIDDGYGYPELIDSKDLPVSLNTMNTIIFNYREAPRNVEGINEHLREAISKVIK